MRRTCTSVALMLLAALTPPARAADYRVTAFTSPATGITDTQPVQFIIQIDGSVTPQLRPPSLRSLTNLKLIAGPNTSSNFSWRNGQANSSFRIIYTLLPEGEGKAAIPGLEFEIEGQIYRTEPIQFDVASSPGGAPVATPALPGRPTPQEDTAADVFIEARLGQEEIWVGQATPLTVLLYTVPRISSPMWRQTPIFDSFWVESVDVNPDDEAYRQRVGSKIFTVYPVERKLLIPLSPGTIELEPYVAQMQVRSSGADLFDILSRRRSQTIVRKTDPIRIEVRALPEGAPAGFSGAVGKFTLDVELGRKETSVNDAVALRVTVAGEGSLRSVEAPVFNAPPELKLFSPKLTESVGLTQGATRSKKTWEWIMVPLTPGEIRLPEIGFPYFDPESGSYVVARSQGPLLAVTRTEGVEEHPVTGRSIEAQRRDLAFIKPLRGELSMGGSRVHQQSWFAVTLVLPALLMPLVIALGRRRSRLMQDQRLVRARKAGSRARRSLQTIKRQAEQRDAAAFHEELARALVGYVADRFDRSPTGLTYDLADELLGSQGVPAALRRRFRGCLESCDFARFVPATAKTERRREVLEEAAGIIEELERSR